MVRWCVVVLVGVVACSGGTSGADPQDGATPGEDVPRDAWTDTGARDYSRVPCAEIPFATTSTLGYDGGPRSDVPGLLCDRGRGAVPRLVSIEQCAREAVPDLGAADMRCVTGSVSVYNGRHPDLPELQRTCTFSLSLWTFDLVAGLARYASGDHCAHTFDAGPRP